MKSVKRFVAILAAALITLGLSIPVFADDPEPAVEPGITVNNAVDGETYTAYLLLHATYQGTLGNDTRIAYYYQGASTDKLYQLMVEAGLQFDGFVDRKAYLKVQDSTGVPIAYTETQIKNLAASINAALTADPPTLSLTPAADPVEAAGGTAVIPVTEKGLYFVDTTLGSICSIDTAGAAEIHEKNSAPTLTKEVQEDTNGNWYTATAAEGLTVGIATAAFDDHVLYRLTVNTGTNSYAQGDSGVDANYVITDTLPAGMTYVAGTAKTTTSGITVNADNAVWNADTRELTITLDAAEVAALGQNKNIVIEYKATFTEDAVANTNYTNTAVLKYKEQESTSSATVKSYEFTILKINDDEEPSVLEGVTFTVFRNEDEKYLNSNGEWKEVEQGATAPELTTNEYGKILVTGIDDGTYTVTEIRTLDGYNRLDKPVTVVVALDGSVSISEGSGTASNGVVTIVNQSGTVLPSTGGIGTTIFYVVGGVLVIGAVVLLITRRRTQKNK